jgi:NADP-dependent 3-hydroxy acid dehydrogenase YdfG
MKSEVVEITGASSGLGRAIVYEFARIKAKIGIAGWALFERLNS